jgi:hypothetical protein
MHVFSPPYQLHAPPISVFLNWSPECLVRSTDHKAFRYVVFSIPCYLFSKTLSLRSSLNVSDQVSYPHKTTGKVISLYIIIFVFLYRKLEDIRFCTEWQQACFDFSLLLIDSWMEFWFFRAVSKYLNCFTLSNWFVIYFIFLFDPAFSSRDRCWPKYTYCLFPLIAGAFPGG